MLKGAGLITSRSRSGWTTQWDPVWKLQGWDVTHWRALLATARPWAQSLAFRNQETKGTEGQRDGWVKGTCCSSRGSKLSSSTYSRQWQPSVTPAPGDRIPLASMGTWTQVHKATYRHTQLHIMKNKKIFLKSILNIIYLFIHLYCEVQCTFKKTLLCVSVFSVHASKCSTCMCCLESGENVRSLELEYRVVSCHVRSGNWTQVPLKSSKCF